MLIKIALRVALNLLIGIILISSSCNEFNIRLNKIKRSINQTVATQCAELKTNLWTAPENGIDNKFVLKAEEIPTTYPYIIVFGSIRNSQNAKKYQDLLRKKGFASVILKDKNKLHGDSISIPDGININRNEIKHTENCISKNFDTWLIILIHMK